MEEALKLALDALEEARTNDDSCEKWDRNKKAITAIKEALAQTSTQCEKQPAQEPDELAIAYMSGLYDGKKKRPWVGLTDDEHCDIWYKESLDWMEYGKAIEAKLKAVNGFLKEKNT